MLSNSQELEVLVAENDIVFVDFWAAWCAPCRQFSAVFERVAEQNPAITFAKINIQNEPELAEKFQIRSIPFLVIFKQGIVIYAEAGSMPESTLTELVGQALTADVSAIRANIDGRED